MSAGFCIPAANVKRDVAKKARANGKKARVRLDEAAVSECSNVYFQLPEMPVPLSACFNNFGRRRIESKRYTAWKHVVDAYVGYQWTEVVGTPSQPTITGPVSVRYIVARPDGRKRDLDNLLKALNDTLTRLRIIEDDSCIVELRIAWAPYDLPSGSFVEVDVERAGVIREVAP